MNHSLLLAADIQPDRLKKYSKIMLLEKEKLLSRLKTQNRLHSNFTESPDLDSPEYLRKLLQDMLA
jgi:hypothetical protein